MIKVSTFILYAIIFACVGSYLNLISDNSIEYIRAACNVIMGLLFYIAMLAHDKKGEK